MLQPDMPSATHPNAIRITAAKQAVTPGKDITPMRSVEHPGLIAHIPGRSPIGGTWQGRDQLMAAVQQLGALAEGTLQIEPNVVATDHFAINSQRVTASRKGRQLNQILLEVWRLENGVGVEIWDHFEDQEAWDAFWQ